jgi:hypothetical protein
MKKGLLFEKNFSINYKCIRKVFWEKECRNKVDIDIRNSVVISKI